MIKLFVFDNKLKEICVDVKEEFINASKQYGNFRSAHEGYAVLLEEVDELWDAIKMKQTDPKRILLIKKNAKQVSAMAIRMLYDLNLKFPY